VSEALRRLIEALPVKTRLGLAVSGGGDSMALLHLAAPLGPEVATVHHHLRPEADAEVALVAATCARLGLRHHVLHWQAPPKGNLQDAARRSRRDLLAAWAGPEARTVLLAHTQDDVAETFLMRLSRGAGVDGLAEMAGHFTHRGTPFLRPLLTASRADLRAHLRALGAAWAEDASNADPRYLRARIRATLPLPPETLAQSARHLAEARHALEVLADLWQPRAFAATPFALAPRPDLFEAPPETRRRLLTRALLWLAPADYPPRGTALARLLEALAAGRPATLGGVRFDGKQLFREARALPPPVPPGALWDGRFTAQGPEEARLGPLGPDLPPDWRTFGLPRGALAASPALRCGEELLCAPAIMVNHPETTIRAVLPQFGPLTDALSR
jgi:tRNA(Ile)-lysidine synthase